MATELMPGQRRLSPVSIGADLLLVVWFVFSLFPIVWMVLLSLKTQADQTSTYFTFSPTLDNFARSSPTASGSPASTSGRRCSTA